MKFNDGKTISAYVRSKLHSGYIKLGYNKLHLTLWTISKMKVSPRLHKLTFISFISELRFCGTEINAIMRKFGPGLRLCICPSISGKFLCFFVFFLVATIGVPHHTTICYVAFGTPVLYFGYTWFSMDCNLPLDTNPNCGCLNSVIWRELVKLCHWPSSWFFKMHISIADSLSDYPNRRNIHLKLFHCILYPISIWMIEINIIISVMFP